MDIRNYFAPVGGRKPDKTSNSSKNVKKKKLIVDSDEEDPLPSSTKKPKILASDSDDDIFESKKTKKPSKPKKEEKPKKKSLPKPETPKLKPASVSDFFGRSPIVRKVEATVAAKKPKVEEVIEVHSDDEFEQTLKVLDEEQKVTSKSRNEEKPRPNENSPPNVMSSKSGLASKLSAKIKEKEDKGEKLEKNRETGDEITPSKERKLRENKETPHSQEKKRKYSDDPDKDAKGERSADSDGKMHKKPKISPIKEETSKASSKGKHHSEENKNKEEKKKSKIKHEIEITPNKVKDYSERNKESKSASKADKVSPKKSEEVSDLEQTPTQDEKKKNARASYFKFLQRSGPSNPGSKPIPDGAPGCLQSMVFVLTGVLDSLDRDEVSELIKKYGGKVTTSVSRNTTYLIVGNEPGESKMKKAEQIGTKQVDEDGLLDLIRTLPGKGSNEERNGKDKTPVSKKLKAFERDSKGNTPAKSIQSSPVSHREKTSSLSTYNQSTPKQNIESCSQSPSASKSQDSGCSSGNSSPSTQPLSTQELLERSQESLMWVDKYKPTNVKNIIGQQGDRSNVKKLLFWLQNWKKNNSGDKKLVRPSPWAKDDNGAFFKCALLSGPPGVGKTTTAHLVCRECGFDFVELNASDARSKRRLDEVVSELLSNQSLAGFAGGTGSNNISANHALVMDEVDGMSGNEDRGGVQELIALIKKSKVPIIAMCNDRNHPKIRSLANYCFDLRFNKPRIEQIRGPMMSVCFREGIKIKPDALNEIIMGANQDVRQILHHLSMWSANQKNLAVDDMKREAEKAKKNFKLGPWDVCKKVFTESDHKNMSIHDKSGLFFHDYSISPLFVQENYPKAVPHIAKGNRRTTLEQLAKTAGSLADGDLVERAIRSRNAWALLPVQAMFSSVLPGDYMSGHLSGQIEFPKWLGNNSRRNKFDRLMQELQMHMRLRISGTKLDVSLDYCEPLRNAIATPLINDGADGVHNSVEVMNMYNLLREDLDSMMELTQWPGSKDPMSKVDSKVKAAFTRAYNKEGHMTPFAAVSVTKKKKGSVGGDTFDGDEEEEEEEEENEDDITKNAMIKVKKASGKKDGEAGSSKGRGRGSSSNSSDGSNKRKGKGRGKK